MGKRLFVGNLAFDATETDLREAFAEAGDIASIKIILDRDTGRPRGFAFVEMGTDEEASQAINTLNGRELLGRPLTVREAQDRAPGGGGGGGPRRGDFGVFGGLGGRGRDRDRDRDRDRGRARKRW
jgi:cold-inducible RNA-binding protein